MPLKEAGYRENTAKRDSGERERRHFCRGLIHPALRKVFYNVINDRYDLLIDYVTDALLSILLLILTSL